MNGGEIPEGVEIEQVWAIEAEYAPDGEARRRPVRHAHLANLAQLMREGVVAPARVTWGTDRAERAMVWASGRAYDGTLGWPSRRENRIGAWPASRVARS